MLVIFGLNKFLDFIPMGNSSTDIGTHISALSDTGFIFPLIAGIASFY